jgi:phenylpyruvate tautomerase PptA (4-oxalocrotonate tautomerase family)
MPLVRIALRAGKPTEYRRAVADAVHQCMVSELKAPADDRFQIITQHDSDSLIYDPTYLNISRSDDVVFIQITLNQGRTLEAKRRFYRAVVNALAARPGIRTQDVLINLVEVAKENWSFGDGIAQYAPDDTVRP